MSIEFTLEGLTPRQMFLADTIWACNTAEAVKGFIRSLPTRELKQEAEAIVEMMKMAVVEQCYDGLGSMDEAQQLINKVSK
jgi:hypothetical protein